jgi:hypothetical protein
MIKTGSTVVGYSVRIISMITTDRPLKYTIHLSRLWAESRQVFWLGHGLSRGQRDHGLTYYLICNKRSTSSSHRH